MKRFGFICYLALGFGLVLSNASAQDDARSTRVSTEATVVSERRVALVIGNSAYQHTTTLKNPVNDATEMAKALGELEFEVQLEMNASQKEMEGAIRAFGKSLEAGGTGLFYYSGHGIQHEGHNWLVPVDAEVLVEADLKYENVDVGRVLENMKAAQNRLNILILDACRNSPFRSFTKDGQQGLAGMNAPIGTLISFATAPGNVALDGSGDHSPYTQALLQEMRRPGQDLEDTFKAVRERVAEVTNRRQVPWDHTTVLGDFFFQRLTSKDVASETTPEPTPTWSRIDPPFTPRALHSSVVHQGRMWVMGGLSNGQQTNDVWSSVDGENWEQVTTNASWSPRSQAVALSFQGQLVLLGGESIGRTLSSEVWSSTDGHEWTLLTNSPGWDGRKEFDAIVHQGAIYVHGGWTGKSTQDLWRSEDGQTWTQLKLPLSMMYRKAYQLLSYRGRLWIIGGEAFGYRTDIWSTTDGTQWSRHDATGDYMREAFGLVRSRDEVWLLGGYRHPKTINSVIHSSNLKEWESTDPPPWSPRLFHSSLYFNDEIWLIGGQSSLTSQPLDEIWHMEP